jgi:hypothetical protein
MKASLNTWLRNGVWDYTPLNGLRIGTGGRIEMFEFRVDYLAGRHEWLILDRKSGLKGRYDDEGNHLAGDLRRGCSEAMQIIYGNISQWRREWSADCS